MGKNRFTNKILAAGIAACMIMSVLWPAPQVKAYDMGGITMPHNVILMISDGCGYNQIKATDYYQYGAEGQQIYETFPVQYGMSTYSTGDAYDPVSAWKTFDYVKSNYTDSAAAATAMASGVKTYDAAIGVDISGKAVTNIVEVAESLNKSTGVVTSVEMSHATPAAFVAHNTGRDNYSAIAEEMIRRSAVDVIMGAGHPFYDNNGRVKTTANYIYVGGQTVWEGLVSGSLSVADADGDGTADPWTLIQTKAEFDALAVAETTPKRLIGIPQVYETLQQRRSGDVYGVNSAAFNATVPTLDVMAKAAINVLDNNPDGFFLMIEGGAVDWSGHSNYIGRMIEEEIAFNRAVEAVCAWVESNSNWQDTLLIVTGDHETGYLTGPGSGTDANLKPVWTEIGNNGIGKVPTVQWNSTSHTNSLVPLFAKGDAASRLSSYADGLDPVRGYYVDNTELSLCMAYPYVSADIETVDGLSAQSASYNSVQLAWQAADHARYYEVSRSESSTGPFAVVGNLVGTTSYTDTGLTMGKTYYYKVRGCNIDGPLTYYGQYSDTVSAVPVLAGVTGLTASRPKATMIQLTWSAVAGGSGYEVWQRVHDTGSFVLQKTTTSASYSNTKFKAGVSYDFQVRAYRLVGKTKVYGNYSAIVTK